MSKLFEALQKIEQQNVQEPLSPVSSVAKKPTTRPTTAIFLFLLLIIVGIVILYYLNNQTRLFSFENRLIPNLKTNAVHAIAEEKETRKSETKPPQETNNFSDQNKPAWPDTTAQQQQATKIPPAANTPPKMEFSDKQVLPDTTAQQRPTISSPEMKRPLPGKQKAFVNRPDNPAVQLQKPLEDLKRTVQQILYQAEERRKEGDMEGAVILYRHAWKLKKSPAIANNLAAGLFALKKYNEAHSLLQKALDMTPDDADLQYNLNITQERLTLQKTDKTIFCSNSNVRGSPSLYYT